MNIIVNGKQEQITEHENLQQLLERQGLSSGFAVMLNRQLVTRSEYANTRFADQDQVDIIVPMQGG
ncbi:sulfur carrier protein ThiS [Gynuella sunshinyii]|uniref:Sulfur transfer protein involved in thiamine biosynthesis n=1 Tax=Gynuella sunshinyii YC6258 TaxID=1445510 RepID=A0A0C5VUI6_9GAMM|nr:sulfur carrier protein ThiS [Gynuella sunshinyii]AJQ97811.1 sulfur transfer protein involved in thiamine biosynthesis [Gynuella sunshinyii YC6258]